MDKNRLEAFSDGVLAIVITILVLEIKVPHGSEWKDLLPLVPVFGAYVLSFIYLGIYWNNHHHMLQTIKKSTGGILWANLHLLFWLSMIPFVTGWVGENHIEKAPIALYGIVLFMAANAYFVLQKVIIRVQGEGSVLAKAVGRDFKGKISTILYLLSIIVAFYVPWVSVLIYVLVAALWLVPDKRIERVLLNS
jgi:uncharacterized membrane protein